MSRVARKLAAILPVMIAMLLVAPVAWSQNQPISAAQLHSLELDALGSDALYSPFGTYLAVITRSNVRSVLLTRSKSGFPGNRGSARFSLQP